MSFCKEQPQSLIDLVAYERVARDYSMSMSRYLLQGHAVFGGMIDRQGQRGDKAFCPTWGITCEALSHTSQNASDGADPMVAHPRPCLWYRFQLLSLRVTAVSRIGVQKTVWEWERPFGSTYTAPGCQKKAESPGGT